MTNDTWNTVKVLLVNIGAITITAADIQIILSVFSFLLASSYTIWKWWNDVKKKRAALKKHNEEKGDK